MRDLWHWCLFAVAALVLLVAGLWIYIVWLGWRLHRAILAHRLPQVARDGTGRRIRERL
jgi:hypothetical protein